MASWDNTRNAWRISARSNTPEPGVKRQRVVRLVREPNTAAGKAAAEKAERKLRDDTDAALAASDGKLPRGTFAEFAMGWLARAQGKKGPWSPRTKLEHAYQLEHYILPHLATVRLDKVVPPVVIRNMYGAWAQAGFKPSTTQRWASTVRAIFNEAEVLGEMVGPNPMRRAGTTGGPAPERRAPAPADVRAVIDAVQSKAAKVFFEVKSETGARRGTLVGLRWQDVDTDTGVLNYVQAITLGPDGPVPKANKGGRAYTVTLDPGGRALAALREHKARAEETAMAMGLAARWRRGDLYVFSKDGGEHEWDVSWPSHCWRKAADKVGVPSRLHDVRHATATHLAAHKVDTRDIAERLGCTEANVIRTYKHRVPGAGDREAAKIMADLMR